VDAAAHWKDRSPMVERIVHGTIRSEDEAERSRWRVCIPETSLQQHCAACGAITAGTLVPAVLMATSIPMGMVKI